MSLAVLVLGCRIHARLDVLAVGDRGVEQGLADRRVLLDELAGCGRG